MLKENMTLFDVELNTFFIVTKFNMLCLAEHALHDALVLQDCRPTQSFVYINNTS